MKKQKKRKGQKKQMRCPYCGSTVIFRSSEGIYRDAGHQTMLYVCSRYPKCDAYVRVHPGTNIPMGNLADHNLRKLRRRAHYYFDQLYKSGLMTKRDAYHWLADQISAPLSQAHIGYMGEYYCRIIIEQSRRLLNQRNQGRMQNRFESSENAGRSHR